MVQGNFRRKLSKNEEAKSNNFLNATNEMGLTWCMCSGKEKNTLNTSSGFIQQFRVLITH